MAHWDMQDFEKEEQPQPNPDTSFEGSYSRTPVLDHMAEAQGLLEDFPEYYDTLDVITILLIAVNELGKDRVIGWDIARAAKALEKTVGTFNVHDCDIEYIMTSE